MSTILLQLWAKQEPFHPLLWHCIDVGVVADHLLASPVLARIRQILKETVAWPEDAAAGWVFYIISLHDIGKCDCDFQGKWPEAAERLQPVLPFRTAATPSFRHEARSAAWVLPHLELAHGCDHKTALTLASVVRGHHGSFHPAEPPHEQPAVHLAWGEMRDQLANCLGEAFGIAVGSAGPRILDHGVAGTILSGLLVMSDWIASNPQIFAWPRPLADTTLVAEYVRASSASALKALRSLGLLKRVPFRAGTRFLDAWKGLAISHPRPIQEVADVLAQSERSPGLAIIEAPMGEGKTEAALHLASQWAAKEGYGGIYVALPTAATSNQMYGRIKQFLNQFDQQTPTPVGLVHGMSWILDAATPNVPSKTDDPAGQDPSCEWFRPTRRAMLAPLAVGTVDQALMAMLHVRFGFLRLLGLSKSVLVIDEVHAYDAYMSTILERLLEWCGTLGVPVILLSATLPRARKAALVKSYCGSEAGGVEALGEGQSYPLVTLSVGKSIETIPCQSSTSKQVRLVQHPGLLGNCNGVAKLVKNLVNNGGCACIILNTVKMAQEVFACLNAFGDADTEVMLFHSRFPAGRRAELEQAAMAWFDKRSLLPLGHADRTIRPQKAILVATQVVEQSLDLDFDVLITEIAPVDLVLQRIGRLHRHDRPERPTEPTAEVHVLLPPVDERPKFGPTENVYCRFVLLKSLAAFHGRTDIHIPQDIRPLVESVYAEGPPKTADSHTAGLSDADMAESLAGLLRYREQLTSAAERCLIPRPYVKAFKLERMTLGAFEEDSGSDGDSFFHASTRYGDETVRAILVMEDQFHGELHSPVRPPRSSIRELLLQEVPVPRWWMRGLQPADGFEPVSPAPEWLPGRLVLRMNQLRWSGTDADGRAIALRYDLRIGVYRQEGD